MQVRRLGQWAVADLRAFWTCILGAALALTVSWHLAVPEELRVRIAGYLITLLGVGLVVRGMAQTRELFGRPSLKARIVAWAARLRPILFGDNVVVIAGAGSIQLGGHASLTLVTTPPNPTWLLSRIEALETEVRRLDHRITESARGLTEEVTALRSALDDERAGRDLGLALVQQRLEAAVASGLDWAMVGAFWVVTGQACSSFPSEVANFLHRA